MSRHLVAFNAIEAERIALIDRYTDLIERVIDEAVATRLAERLSRLPPAALAPRSQPPFVPARRGRPPAGARPTAPSPRTGAAQDSPAESFVAILPTMPSRTPTPIPAHIQITRLPPGPAPSDRKRSGPPMECRLPGCLMKSRGPRYEYFCEDHYRQLNADERRKYAEQWRAARAAQRA